MKEKPQKLEQQVHIEPASAQVEPEYSLEDIMNEFGGWSKREQPPATEEASVQPDVWPPEKSGGAQEPPAAQSSAGDTIRFTPIAQPEPEDPPVKIWSYKGEAAPNGPDPSDAARRRKAAAQQRRLARYQKREQRRMRRRQEQPDVAYASA